MASDAWGVDDGYWDALGGWHETSGETAATLRRAMGSLNGSPDPGPEPSHPLRVVHLGEVAPVDAPAELTLEDGTEVAVDGHLPPDLPIGYHTLRPRHGSPGEPGWVPTRLIVSPGRCHLPDNLHSWVLTVQLHSCRSDRSWGIGDLGDLRRIGTWAGVRGAGLVALNPLHAPLPTDHVQPSPYFPSSRRWRNPLYLAVDELPGAAIDPEIARLAEAARELSSQRLIDRDAVWHLKRAALERMWPSIGPGDARLTAWRAGQGDALESYARFCALAEHHGRGWTGWPAQHHHPASPGVASFAARHADRIAFWAWVQLLVDDQLERANQAVPLLQDLAIGVDPDGAEAWMYQDLLAGGGIRVGAPPDRFNTAGQDWGLPPFVPWKLRDAGYQPLAELWRSSLRPGGGLRIDHVMGLFRLFWILPEQGPAEGAYVRYPADELLAVLAVESTRAGALVVGEDLGTVEDGVRDRLAMGGILSTRIVWFDWDPPESFPAQAFAAVTTHDLPTVAGVWAHDDVADQRATGLPVDEDAAWQMRHRLAELSGAGEDGSVEDVIVGVHRRLAGAPSMLVSATIEDALAVTQRPNMPGTVSERPNWSLALPLPLDEILADPLVNAVAAALREGRRLTTPPPPPLAPSPDSDPAEPAEPSPGLAPEAPPATEPEAADSEASADPDPAPAPDPAPEADEPETAAPAQPPGDDDGPRRD